MTIKMMLAVLAAVLFPQLALSQGQPLTNIYEGVVYIRIVGPDGNLKDRGSGFLLGESGFIMTAGHVLNAFNPVNDKITVSLKTKASAPIPARKFSCETDGIDLCLLYIHSTNVAAAGIKNYFRLSCKEPILNESLMAAGFPTGDTSPMVVTPGSISSLEYADGMRYFMTTPVYPGMSGGPVFNRDGHVIGVIFGAVQGLSLSSFTPVVHGVALLAKARSSCGTVSLVSAEDAAPSTPMAFPAGQAQSPNAMTLPDPSPAETGWGRQVEASQKTVTGGSDGVDASKLQMVYIQVSNEVQRRVAEDKIVNSLKAAGIPVEERADLVRSSPRNAEIRFGNEVDRENAERVRNILESSGTEKFTLKRIKGATGIIEVWYPKS